MQVDDWADAILYLLQFYDAEPTVNVGRAKTLTIRDLEEAVMSAIGYRGALTFDHYA
jgi:GDP-L-fucose synthase